MLDGQNVASYLYTQRELEALLRGGVQRLWVGNVKSGQHEFTAFLTGKGPERTSLHPWCDRPSREGARAPSTWN